MDLTATANAAAEKAAEKVENKKSNKGAFSDHLVVVTLGEETLTLGAVYSTYMPKEKLNALLERATKGMVKLDIKLTNRLDKNGELSKMLNEIDTELGLTK